MDDLRQQILSMTPEEVTGFLLEEEEPNTKHSVMCGVDALAVRYCIISLPSSIIHDQSLVQHFNPRLDISVPVAARAYSIPRPSPVGQI